MKIKQSFGDRVIESVIWIVLGTAVLLCLYPLWLVFINSFSDPDLVARGEVLLVPKGFRLDAYVTAFAQNDIVRGYANTLFYTVFGTALNMVLTIPTAYAMSKKKLFGGNAIMMLFLFTMYFSGGLIPTFLVMRGLHLLNTRWVIILMGGVNTSNLIVARSFFASGVPVELEEAAEIDGCNQLQTFFRVVLPLSKAMLGVIMLYYAVARWNNYTTALYYLPTASEKWPLQLVIRNMLEAAKTTVMMMNDSELLDYYQKLNQQMRYSVIVLASAPMLAIFPFLQKYFEKGVMLGSLKG